MVVGDWGRRGAYNQSQVARQMGITSEKLNVDFIISTGDNFYDDGLINENDPAFDDSFSNIYTAPSLNKQWYHVLGNHDYRGDVLAQLSPVLTERDWRWRCLRSYIVSTEIGEFFFVDTTPFQDKYFTDPGEHTYDWRGVMPREHYLSSHHGSTVELVNRLLPILQANNVDLYINGHDHCLEHISSSDSPIQFLTSGGGSKAWKGDIQWWDPNELKFYYDGQGFMALKLTNADVEITFYDIFGKILHQWGASKSLHHYIK
ncbi:hypothetical protein Leryth_016963 [Lithospermum erythrorhizon]|nr:hypothetical protein Leryth_016963 [Lithospermum erythrorhizon]